MKKTDSAESEGKKTGLKESEGPSKLWKWLIGTCIGALIAGAGALVVNHAYDVGGQVGRWQAA